MKASYIITQNKFNAILNQETTEIKVSFKTGYYPLTGGGGGDLSNYYTKDETYSKTEVDDIIADIPVVDTSNLVPYTGATQDVNIASNYFRTSKGFDFTKDSYNYFRTFHKGDYNHLEFYAKDNSTDNFGKVSFRINPEEGMAFQKYSDSGNNIFQVDIDRTYSIKKFVTEEGYQILNGTATQALRADGGVFDLTTKLDKGGYTKTAQDLKNDIDNLQIGGRNLMLNSKGEIASYHFPVTTSEPLIEGCEYTLSVDVFGTLLGHVFINDSITSVIRESNFNSTTNYRRVSVTFTFVKNDYLGCEIYPHFYSVDKVKNIKLEKGNIATDWEPNPEDKQDRLQNISDNIGIGKPDASAAEKLDVNGNIKATGFKTPTGTATQGLKANGDVFDLNTKADLDGGKVPAWQLPSYVDDVLEYANLASFPTTGESGKIYIAIDTNLTYRWGGSSYVVMSSSLALGETSSTAYRGDRGKIAYDHSQVVGNPHGTKLDELTDVSVDATYIADTDVILKKEVVGGLWRKITFANFKSWFTTELAKKINIGLDTVFNFKNISAMTLPQFKALTPNLETIYFTEEQNVTGWQQIRYNGLGISIPATTETKVSITDENYIELDSDSTFNLIDIANTKINGIFEKDFVIIKFNAGVVTPATANQWFKVILKVNNVQTAVSPVFYLTEISETVEQIAHNFALNVPSEMVTNGATLHLKTSVAMTFNNPAISVVRVHKSTNANL